MSRLGIFRLLGKCVNHYTTPLVDVRTCNIFIMGFCPRTPRLRCWCDPSSTRSLALSVVLPYGLPLGHSELSRPEICLHVCEKRSGVNKVHFKLNDTPIMIRDSILQGCNAILTKSVPLCYLLLQYSFKWETLTDRQPHKLKTIPATQSWLVMKPLIWYVSRWCVISSSWERRTVNISLICTKWS